MERLRVGAKPGLAGVQCPIASTGHFNSRVGGTHRAYETIGEQECSAWSCLDGSAGVGRRLSWQIDSSVTSLKTNELEKDAV
jgi:hypothetical protein